MAEMDKGKVVAVLIAAEMLRKPGQWLRSSLG